MTSWDRNKRQLDLLREIAQVLRVEGIAFWLRGGWALDFLRGRTDRPHADLDLVVCLRRRDRVEAVLSTRGYVGRSLAIPQAQLDFSKRGEEVSFVLIERGEAGQVVTPGFETWPWPTGAFEGPVRTLHGITCQIVASSALLEEKESFRLHVGNELREKDRESIHLLRELLSFESP